MTTRTMSPSRLYTAANGKRFRVVHVSVIDRNVARRLARLCNKLGGAAMIDRKKSIDEHAGRYPVYCWLPEAIGVDMVLTTVERNARRGA